jgi:membrane protease YdiL (CAAX protease family)
MNLHPILQPEVIVAALLILLPMLVAGFAPKRVTAWIDELPRTTRLACPVALCVPYALVAHAFGVFRWGWLALYALLPVAIALILNEARSVDTDRRGNWRDYAILAVLGLAVDLRWFEPAWPIGFAAFGKMLLLDAGIFGFLAVRQLDGVGFDLRLKRCDVGVGLREFLLYAVIAIPLGLGLGFLHFHSSWPQPVHAFEAFVFTFLFIAIPEELFFRGWLQNLARNPHRTHGSAGSDRAALRAHTLEQADHELQLALCVDGRDCRGFLRQGVACSATCGRFFDYPCDRRYFVVALVAVKMVRRAIVEIAEADAHIMQHGYRNGDGDANAEDCVRHGQRPDVTRLEKDEACSQPPAQSQQGQDRIGQVRCRKDDSRRHRGHGCAGHQANEASEKIALQQELLRHRPDRVATEREYPLDEAAWMMQCVMAAGIHHCSCSQHQRHANHPGRSPKTCGTAAHRLPAGK